MPKQTCVTQWIIALACAGGSVLLPAAVHADGVSSARVQLDSAEKQLLGASQDVSDARRALDYANSAQASALSRASNSQSSLQSLRSLLDDPTIVQNAGNDAAAAAKAASDRAALLEASQKRLSEIQIAILSIRSAAQKVYESSPAYVTAVQSLDLAQRQLDDATAASESAMRKDPGFIQFRTDADRLEAIVKPLRDNPNSNPEQLSAASQSWIKAEGQVGLFRQNWINSDRGVLDARAAVASAQRARQDLETRFQADLATDPNLIAAMKDRDAEEARARSLADDLRLAQAAQAAAERRARDLAARMAEAQAEFNRVNAENMAAQQELNATGFDLDNAGRRLDWALQRRDQILDQRNRAARDLQLALDDHRRQQIDRDRLEHDRLERDRQDRINGDRELSNRDEAREKAERQKQEREQEFTASRASNANPPGTLRPPPQPPLKPSQTPPPFATKDESDRRARDAAAASQRELDQRRLRESEQRAAAARQQAEQRSREVSDREQAASRDQQRQRDADAAADQKRQAEALAKEQQQVQKSRDEAQQRASDAQKNVDSQQRAADAKQREMEQQAKSQQQEQDRQNETRSRQEAQAKSDADRAQREADQRQRDMEAQSRQQQQDQQRQQQDQQRQQQQNQPADRGGRYAR